jgi:amino acid transporter
MALRAKSWKAGVALVTNGPSGGATNCAMPCSSDRTTVLLFDVGVGGMRYGGQPGVTTTAPVSPSSSLSTATITQLRLNQVDLRRGTTPFACAPDGTCRVC